MSDKLILGDSRKVLKEIVDDSIHLVVTDPPYFIDGMCSEWDNDKLYKKKDKAGVVKGLPVGMKFDPDQGRKFQDFMSDISSEVYRVLKPGGFYIAFSQARLYHRLAIAAEDCGFEIRDMLGWVYEGQAKAFSQDHFVNKMDISDVEKASIIESLGGRKTPQLKPCIEPMILAQKPKDGTFVDNWLKHETGLIDTNNTIDGKFPANIINAKKPDQNEKAGINNHLTVKPINLMEYLITVFSKEGQMVLDPFMGSGTTGVACMKRNRQFIGIEINLDYYSISEQRIKSANKQQSLF